VKKQDKIYAFAFATKVVAGESDEFLAKRPRLFIKNRRCESIPTRPRGDNVSPKKGHGNLLWRNGYSGNEGGLLSSRACSKWTSTVREKAEGRGQKV